MKWMFTVAVVCVTVIMVAAFNANSKNIAQLQNAQVSAQPTDARPVMDLPAGIKLDHIETTGNEDVLLVLRPMREYELPTNHDFPPSRWGKILLPDETPIIREHALGEK